MSFQSSYSHSSHINQFSFKTHSAVGSRNAAVTNITTSLTGPTLCVLDWWALFLAFALRKWRTITKKLQNVFPRPYPCIPLINLLCYMLLLFKHNF